MKPYISIIILSYNYGHMLRKALNACAEQTFRDFEIIMVNNGSTDNTEEEFQNFCNSYPDIQTAYVHVPVNQGPGHGWNEGLKSASGKYVMFCDADDWMEQGCLEKLAGYAKQTGADRIVGQFRDIDADGKVVQERPFVPAGKTVEPRVPTFGMIQGSIFRRSVIVENGITFLEAPGFLYYDSQFTLTYIFYEKSYALIRQNIYNYYYNANSLVSKVMKEQDPDKYYDKFAKPNMEGLAATVSTKNNISPIRDSMIYLVLYNYSVFLLRSYLNFPYSQAKQFHNKLSALLYSYIPDYRKCPLAFPIGNGYRKSTSIGIWGIILLERLHAVWMMRILVFALRHTNYIR